MVRHIWLANLPSRHTRTRHYHLWSPHLIWFLSNKISVIFIPVRCFTYERWNPEIPPTESILKNSYFSFFLSLRRSPFNFNEFAKFIIQQYFFLHFLNIINSHFHSFIIAIIIYTLVLFVLSHFSSLVFFLCILTLTLTEWAKKTNAKWVWYQRSRKRRYAKYRKNNATGSNESAMNCVLFFFLHYHYLYQYQY